MTNLFNFADRAKRQKRSQFRWTEIILLGALIAGLLGSLMIGRFHVPLLDVVRIVLSGLPFRATGDYDNAPWVVIEIIRLPRILLVTLCGMGLALSGATMQGVFRNPLVGPEIAGVSAGATLGGVIALMLGWASFGVVGLAFTGGLAALIAAFALANISGRASILALVLSGVIVSGFCSAIVGLLETLADPMTRLPTIVYWLLGSFVGATFEKVIVVAVVMLVAGTLLLAMRWRINLLSLSEDDATALGVEVNALRWTLMGLVAIMVAAQVSVSGGIGWVGLIVPHMARMIVGPDHSRLLPASALLGGMYLLAMDDLARVATSQEIPIGLLTSVVGTPIFAVLFWKTQARGWTNG
ncbi:MAG: iron ABC transporter permease [Bradyrhizobium sp.]|nr:iron ABC transporter permease [Bradyrhizobium sp.]